MSKSNLWVTLRNDERFPARDVDIAYASLRDLHREAEVSFRLLYDYAKGRKRRVEVPDEVISLFGASENSPMWRVAASILRCMDDDEMLTHPNAGASNTDLESIKKKSAKRLIDALDRLNAER